MEGADQVGWMAACRICWCHHCARAFAIQNQRICPPITRPRTLHPPPQIASAIKDNRSIKLLDVGGNNIGETGATALAGGWAAGWVGAGWQAAAAAAAG